MDQHSSDGAVGTIGAQTCHLKIGLAAQLVFVPQLSFGREEQQHNYAAGKETTTKRDEASVARTRTGNEISFKKRNLT